MKNFLDKLGKFWFSFSLRVKLLWIWFIKNLFLFIKIGVFVCVALVMFGFITEDTPLLGALFGTLSTNIKDAMSDANASSLGSVGVSLSTIGFSTYMFLAKAKSIALTDITSRKMKIALIKANLYFNENGHLCKRLEKATLLDLDGDGKVDQTNIEDLPQENIVSGTVRAIGELATVLTAKIDTTSDVDKVMETAELSETVKALDDTSKTDNTINSDTIATTGTALLAAQAVKNGVKNKSKISNFFGFIGKNIKSFFSCIGKWFGGIGLKIKTTFEKRKKEIEVVKKDSAELKVKEHKQKKIEAAEVKEKKSEKIEIVKDEDLSLFENANQNVVAVNTTKTENSYVPETKVEKVEEKNETPESVKSMTAAEKRIKDIIGRL